MKVGWIKYPIYTITCQLYICWRKLYIRFRIIIGIVVVYGQHVFRPIQLSCTNQIIEDIDCLAVVVRITHVVVRITHVVVRITHVVVRIAIVHCVVVRIVVQVIHYYLPFNDCVQGRGIVCILCQTIPEFREQLHDPIDSVLDEYRNHR